MLNGRSRYDGFFIMAYKYKYNGKEWQGELGLNMYAMDMRQYDPAIARWIVQDPIVHHNFSPYNAFDNNPVYWADPSGADANSFFGPDVNGNVRYDSNNMYIPAYLRMDASSEGSSSYFGISATTNSIENSQNTTTWWTLNKESFIKIANALGVTTEKGISNLFEAVMLEYMDKNFADYSFQANSSRIADGASPDGIASPVKIKRNGAPQVSLLSSLYEAKLIRSGGQVPCDKQAKGFISYLASGGQDIKTITYVTSHNVSINGRILSEAKKHDINVRQIFSQYRINHTTKKYEISFYHTQGQSRLYDISHPVVVPVDVDYLLRKWAPFLDN